MGANKPIEDIEATLLAATKSALDELVWWAHATMAAKAAEASFWSSPWRAGRPPVLRLRREGVHRRQARERFQSPGCGHPGCRSDRRGRHRVVFLSSDDEDGTAPVVALAKQLGFAPVKLGKLNEGGALVHARGRTWSQLIFQDLFKKER